MRWTYTKRQDGRIGVLIDNCVWNFLCQRKIDLATELPPDTFALYILREGEIEKDAIPNTAAKKDIIEYIKRTMRECSVEVSSTFGFYIEGAKHQRYGGFDQGTFASEAENDLRGELLSQFVVGNDETGSGLAVDEADLALAVQSAYAIVLTNERPTKNGPLQYAAHRGGKVLYLRDFGASGLTLRAFITAFHEKG
jgi:hypothetical protein